MIPPFFSVMPREVINNPEPLHPRVWKARETTIARASTLWQDGYTCEPIGFHAPGVYRVIVPSHEIEVDKKTGEVFDHYMVDTVAATCSCQGFVHMKGICKHLLATQWLVAQCQNFLAPLHASQESYAARAVALPPTAALPPTVALRPAAPAAPAAPTCVVCNGTYLIPLDDFPGQYVCVGCNTISEPMATPPRCERVSLVHTPPSKSVIHASDWD